MYSCTSFPGRTSRMLMLVPYGFLIALAVAMKQPVLPIHAENWPQWRGPTNNGISLESKLPVRWNRTHNVAWRVALPGRAGSTPVVWNGQIFLTSAEDDKLVVMSFDHTGKELWKRVVSSGNRDVVVRTYEGNSASPSPVTDGQHVWVFFATGDLACYDIHGKNLWHMNLQEHYGDFDIQFGLASSPLLHENQLFLQIIHGPMRSPGEPGFVVALNALTGKEIWKTARTTNAHFECKHSYASPILYQDSDRKYLLTHGSDFVIAHRLIDGKELWRHGGLNPSGSTSNQPKVAIAKRFDINNDGTISRKEIPEGPKLKLFDRLAKLYGINPDSSYTVSELSEAFRSSRRSERSAQPSLPEGYHRTLRFVASPVTIPGLIIVPSAKNGPVLALHPQLSQNPTTVHPSEIWKMPRGTPDVPSPLIHDGLVYLCSENGVLSCIDAKTGQTLYKERFHTQRHRASPIYGDGNIYLTGRDGLVTVVKAGRHFERVAQNPLEEPITASPIVSDGTLYLRSFEALWAIKKGEL